ncbi:phosphate starvation-inducible protein PhoH [Paenibacillus glacialis]|nr:phosphate starvation-inducible protein PhoH [Paenibacillus glacialis]
MTMTSSGTPHFVIVDSGNYFSTQTIQETKKRDDCFVIDMYDLPERDLSPYACMVIDNFVDQELLYQEREQIWQFLNQGKVLIFSGHMFLPWLPGASMFVPKLIRSQHDYEVSIVQQHPIFDGVDPEEMTYTKGVSGFFARGHHPLPSQAEVLLSLPGGEPITYIDRYSTQGTILVHSGNNLFAYSGQGSTVGRIGSQLQNWTREEYRAIQERTRTL